jgi:hypothetical protein
MLDIEYHIQLLYTAIIYSAPFLPQCFLPSTFVSTRFCKILLYLLVFDHTCGLFVICFIVEKNSIAQWSRSGFIGCHVRNFAPGLYVLYTEHREHWTCTLLDGLHCCSFFYLACKFWGYILLLHLTSSEAVAHTACKIRRCGIILYRAGLQHIP